MSTIKTNQLAHTANGAATYTLPQTDGSAGQVLKTDGSGNLSWVSPGGITVADQWRLTSDLSGTDPNDFITTNLERVDTAPQGTLGTGMTESSGVFTFPSTGIYKVDFQFNVFSTSSPRYVGGRIQGTTDNSNYTITLIDVTDNSNVKVKFNYYGIGGVTFVGSSNRNRTFMTFIRLGDT